jgi:hypothetical protein
LVGNVVACLTCCGTTFGTGLTLRRTASCPDVCVPDTTIADRQTVVDLVRSRGWAYEYSADSEVRRVPDRVEDMPGRMPRAPVLLIRSFYSTASLRTYAATSSCSGKDSKFG